MGGCHPHRRAFCPDCRFLSVVPTEKALESAQRRDANAAARQPRARRKGGCQAPGRRAAGGWSRMAGGEPDGRRGAGTARAGRPGASARAGRVSAGGAAGRRGDRERGGGGGGGGGGAGGGGRGRGAEAAAGRRRERGIHGRGPNGSRNPRCSRLGHGDADKNAALNGVRASGACLRYRRCHVIAVSVADCRCCGRVLPYDESDGTHR